MPADEIEETTLLLKAWSGGDREAGDALFARLYDDLRGVASRRLAAEPAGAPDTTVLVHEAFLRLTDQRQVTWRDRRQFFAIAARVMRRILVDQARARGAEKRGGDKEILSIEKIGEVALGERPDQVLALDACLEELARLDADKAKLVDLRFFAGLSIDEAAEVLEVSRATAIRQWRITKGWLHRKLQDS